MKYPPTLSLISMLRDMGEEVCLLTSNLSQSIKEYCKNRGASILDVGYNYSPSNSAFEKLIKIPKIEKSLNKVLERVYDENSVIYVMTSITLKYIGNCLTGKRYVMYMYELSHEIRYYPELPEPKVNLNKLFRNASAVIECEYNRAHIAKAWFGLKELPYVMPNKPYMKPLKPHMTVTDKRAVKLIDKIQNRKIILYQGIIDKERPLGPFVEAVDELGEDYALVVMSGNFDQLKEFKSKNLFLLPFINPPHHLEVTSWAHIGILTYVPVRGETTSPLNAVYCAPNKLFEYSMFGVPMIGNDIPGLKIVFEKEKIGKIFASYNKDCIKKTIYQIEENYKEISTSSSKYYSTVDNQAVLKKVIENLNKK